MNKSYSIDFFLNDPEFIKWVHNPDNESSAYWTTIALQDTESKKAMLKAIGIIRAMKIKKEKPEDSYKQEILNNIVAKIGTDPKIKSGNKIRYIIPIIVKVAAVFLILISSVYIFYQLTSSASQESKSSVVVQNAFLKETAKGTRIQTRLPDGSIVWLNAESQIRYYFDTLSQTRYVHLTGEAFFDVVSEPSKPFIVKTGDISVKAIGTSFNVNTFSNSEVCLLSGVVLVSSNSQAMSSLELSPGEKAFISGSKIKKDEVDYLHDLGWKEGILSFKQADFYEVKEKLERWYGVNIHYTNDELVKNWEVDGKFENLSLEMTLQHFSFTKQFEFRIEENEVYIY
ncbi:MAG: FecR family protein [Cyclobacteriaceae bacterium]